METDVEEEESGAIRQGLQSAVSRSYKAVKSARYFAKRPARIGRGAILLLIPHSTLIIVAILTLLIQENILHKSPLNMLSATILKLITYMIITAIFSTLIVYFLRFLHFMREQGMAFWNEETAPHYQGEDRRQHEVRVRRPIMECRKKVAEWVILSISIWVLFILSLMTIGFLLNRIGVSSVDPNDMPLEFLQEIAFQLPIFGDLVGFSLFPGNSPFGTVSYLTGAIPLAIAIRNLMFIFEHNKECQYSEDKNMWENAFFSILITLLGFITLSSLIAIAFTVDLML